MSCQCEIYEICPECASTPIQYETALKAHDDVVRQMRSPSKFYTLDELEQLAREYLRDSPLTDTLTPELILSSLIAWVRKCEREVE